MGLFDNIRNNSTDESTDNLPVNRHPGDDTGTDPDDIDPEVQSVTGEHYQIDPVEHITEAGVETKVKALSDSPDRKHNIFAGKRVRESLESGYGDPLSPLWTGYDISARQGYVATGIPFSDLFQHLWVCGTTGAGKSVTLLNLMVQLAYGGHGFVYFDPKARDSRDLLKKLPEHRLDDVIWIEPGSTEFERSVTINFLEMPDCDDEDELDRIIKDRLQVLKAIFDTDDYWGINMESITESMGRAMMEHNAEADDPDDYYTLIDFFFILLNAERREDFAESVDDPYVAEFCNEIADMDDDEVRPLLKRIKTWVESRMIRRIIGCRESSIDFQDALDENKIIIVRTPVSDDDIKQMITLGTMRPIWTAVQNNSFEGTPEPFFAFFDEADKVLNDNLGVADMLARARSMKLGVTLACQHPGQLADNGVLRDVKNNCNHSLFFRVLNESDAQTLMKRFRGYDDEDLIETNNYRIWTKVPHENGGTSDPLKLNTFAPAPDLRDDEAVDDVIRASLDQYGASPITDAQIQANLHFGNLGEALDDGFIELDMETEHCRNHALKAIYDESIRQDNPEGFVTVEDCLDRLQRYLPDGDQLTDDGKAWRSVFQKLPDAYLAHRKNDADEREVKALDTSFMNVGESENDGKDEHWEQMADAYVPFTQLGFEFDIPAQTGEAMPDGLARLDDTLKLAGITDPGTVTKRVTDYRNESPLLDRLAGVKDAYIESEHSTGSTQPSQTVLNLVQAHNEGHRCLFLCRGDVAKKVYDTIERAPLGCRSNHSVAGERRFYTDTNALRIDGEQITRPGSKDNVWVHDQETDQYVLRDSEGTEHARFDTPAAIFTDAGAYPDGGDRTIMPPVIPEYELNGDSMADVERDIIEVPAPEQDEDGTKELLTPRDLTLYREDEPSMPLPELPVTDETGPRTPNNESIPENGEATASPQTDEGTQRTDTDTALAENMLSMPNHSSNSS
jgi:hypothetical protein